MPNIEHITVLVNPAAANGNGHTEWLRLQPHFEEAFFNSRIDVIETVNREHATALGESLNTEMIISLSGDGAILDITQGLMRRPSDARPLLAVVPIGSGNDFAKALGVPMNPWLAISRLMRGQRSLIDIGNVNGRYFLNTLSFGVDAVIADRTTELRKSTRRRGFMLYAQAAVGAIIKDLKAHHYKMMIDGEYLERDLLICAIQNGPYYGGGFKVAPRALLDDGLFNICMAGQTSAPAALYYMTRIAQGTHEKLKIVETRKAARISLDFSAPIAAQCDGESLEAQVNEVGDWHFDIELLPQTLEVVSMR